VGIAALRAVLTVAVLSAGFGSGVDEVTTAAFVSVPLAAMTFTTITRVAEADGVKEPRIAETVPVVPTGGPAQIPWLVEQETKTVPAGRGSVTRTPAAVAGPALNTTIV
jgi:hypothetical protein